MKTLFKLIYFLLFLTLNFSCGEKKSSPKENSTSELLHASKTDTFKFTSGIRSIFEDSKGNYWFGSHNEGVCVFDGQSYIYFTTNEGLPDNQIRSIQEDQNGNIWFGTANGVASYDGKKIIKHSPKTVHSSKKGLKNGDHHLWFNAGNKAGVYRFDGQDLLYMPFPILEMKDPYSCEVTDISKGQDGKVWIATYNALFYFDGKEIQLFDENKLALQENEKLHIRSILADSKGCIWIGNNGIGVLRIEKDKTIHFSKEHGLMHANSSKNGDRSPAGTLEHVFVIKEDAQGNIWFGDRDTGSWKFDGKTMTNYVINAELSSQMLWEIYEDKNGNLLFGMAEGGVYRLNGQSFEKFN